MRIVAFVLISLFVFWESYCAQKERKWETESFILFFVRDAESRDPYKKVNRLATANCFAGRNVNWIRKPRKIRPISSVFSAMPAISGF